MVLEFKLKLDKRKRRVLKMELYQEFTLQGQRDRDGIVQPTQSKLNYI